MTSSFRQRRPLLSNVINVCIVCVLIGLLMYLVRGRNFWQHQLYAFAIGIQIAPLISLLQRLAAQLLLRWGGPFTAERQRTLETNWPGWLWMIPVIAIGVLVGLTGGQLLGDWLLGVSNKHWWEATSAKQLLLGLGFTVLVSAVAAYFFFASESLHIAQLAKERSERQASDAQLLALQTQLEPHMLFNTLAHLRVLIGLRPADAQAMLDDLIAYLRATLQASRVPLHPLSTEFERLRDYLSLMQRRMGTRLKVEWDLPADVGPAQVPPLLLQPLVENAIKHGLEPSVAGGTLRIEARRDGDRLLLQVHDDGVGLQCQPATGGTHFGTQQVRERLQTRYGSAAALTLAAVQPQGCCASVHLPLELLP